MANKDNFFGNSDGVDVTQTKECFFVSFKFDRQLVNLMHQIPDAKYLNENTWEVPLEGQEALTKIVPRIRAEAIAIEKDRENIFDLARSTAIYRQSMNGTDKKISPNVGDYLDNDKFYMGEIVNANGRFAAQLTGFGKADGAAFVTVHRMSGLDKPVMKGDVVGIKYNEKGVGEVSDRSLVKSSEEILKEFDDNLGMKSQGVTVDSLDGKYKVAFEFNLAMKNRLQKVDGVVFDNEVNAFIVPAERHEFLARAVADMRNEFVADVKEVGVLKDIAESKLDGAKVQHAFTKDGQSHYGNVIAVGDRYVLQKGGMDQFKLHHRESLDLKSPTVGQNLHIKYNKGIGAVVDLDKQKEHSQALGR